MKRAIMDVLGAFVVTTAVFVSFTFAQAGGNQTNDLGFFEDVSVKIYCTFSKLLPILGSDSCQTDIVIQNVNTGSYLNVNDNAQTGAKSAQINRVVNQTLNRVAYIAGPAGRDGRNGTTTIVYQSVIGAPQASPAAYIYAGGSGSNPNFNPYQTTVPGDIFSTFVHHFQFEDAKGDIANITNINATNTFTVNLTATNFTLGTGTIGTTSIGTANVQNLWANNATTVNSTSTNLFAENASITNATSTFLYSLFSNLINLISTNATITNATTTNLFSTNASITNATATNIFANYASITQSTSTDLFSLRASITEATTTYFFAAWANFLNLFVENLTFKNATGTNLQVANASTTNFSATGTSVIINLYGTLATFTEATSTKLFANAAVLNTAEIKAGNATLTTGVISNATTTNLFSTNASITNSTSTNLFSVFANFINLFANNLGFNSATGTSLQVANASTTNFSATGTSFISELYLASSTQSNSSINSGNATLTTSVIGNATTTNLFANLFKAINANIDNLSVIAFNFTNATGTTLQLADLSTTNIVATGTATITNIFANNIVTNNLTATGTINLGTTTFAGSLIPNASGTYTLGTALLPWSELFVSSSSVYIGGTKISNVDGQLIWGGNAVVTKNGTSSEISLATVNASTTNASTTNTMNLVADFGTITNATTTNLFASLFKVVNATIDGLITVNATITNATTTNLFASWFKATNASIDSLSTMNLLTGNITATGTVTTKDLIASTTNTLGIIATNATLTTATVTNLEVSNFLPGAVSKIAQIATTSTTNSLTFSTTTNILQSIVNGKISTTSLASLAGGASSTGANTVFSLRQSSNVSTSTSTGAGQADTQLTFAAGANEKWIIQATINHDSNGTNPDFAIGVSAPSGSTCNLDYVFNGNNSSSVTSCSILTDTNLSGTNDVTQVTALVSTGATPGNVAINFGRVGIGPSTVQINIGSTLVAYKLIGADLAEVYFAKDTTIEEGDVVALDGTGVSQVVKSNKKYQKNVLGIISTKPGMVIGDVDGEGKAVIVGLSGRVPVKVTDKNGVIKAGDFLTASDIPGVAMRATGAGQVIGQALTDDAGTGKVMVFIKNTYHDGNSDSETEETIADKFTQIVKNTLEKLSDVYLNMTLAISSLKANEVSANKVTVQQLCVGQACFSENEMLEFRNYLDSKKPAVIETQTETPITVPVEEVVATETVTEPVLPVVEEETIVEETPVIENSTTEVVEESPVI